jgi:S-adenosylmethionine hydrolase
LIVTLLTDFGLRDAYVGIMKAVILGLAPDARLIDLTHEVAPQSIRQGAFALAAAVPYCPPGSVHLAVVDPGVGTARSAVVVQTGRARYVAPDNGLLTLALGLDPPVAAWRLTRPAYFLPRVSTTFHGRDVFAPVAAHLASGQAPQDMGEAIDPAALVRFDLAPPRVEPGRIVAAVLYVDRFGNLVTSVHRDDVDPSRVRGARAGGRAAPLAASYGFVEAGGWLSIWGSSGYLEVSQSMGSAAASLSLGEGDAVEVLLDGPDLERNGP